VTDCDALDARRSLGQAARPPVRRSSPFRQAPQCIIV